LLTRTGLSYLTREKVGGIMPLDLCRYGDIRLRMREASRHVKL
jgi:hypothetical protein